MENKAIFADPNVEQVFATIPESERGGLLILRQLIFDVAAHTEGVGEIQETLKWGQPAYLTPQTKSGSTIRLGISKQGGFAIYTHCQTTIMSEFQNIFPTEFEYEGNRAIHFQSAQNLPLDSLKLLISRALTYHLR